MIYSRAEIFFAWACRDIHSTRHQAREFPNLYIVHCTYTYPSVESPRSAVMRLMARTYLTLAAAGEI